MIAEESNVDGTAIGLCPSGATRPDAAIRAAYVFNNDTRRSLDLDVGRSDHTSRYRHE
jgi:hypothetical protein